jgi:hypothetical protein
VREREESQLLYFVSLKTRERGGEREREGENV